MFEYQLKSEKCVHELSLSGVENWFARKADQGCANDFVISGGALQNLNSNPKSLP